MKPVKKTPAIAIALISGFLFFESCNNNNSADNGSENISDTVPHPQSVPDRTDTDMDQDTVQNNGTGNDSGVQGMNGSEQNSGTTGGVRSSTQNLIYDNKTMPNNVEKQNITTPTAK